MSGFEITLGILALVAVVAFVLKLASGDGGDASRPERPSRERDDDTTGDWEEPDFDADDDGAPHETVAMTSDGWSFVPMGHGIRLVPPAEAHDPLAAAPGSRGGLKGLLAGEGEEARAHGPRFERLDVGDLVGARVVRGAPDHDPWRLEGLGRDRDYRAWRFETEEAARAAYALVERRVVRAPRDEDDEPVPVSDADFDAAWREHQEIERELASMGEFDDPEERPR